MRRKALLPTADERIDVMSDPSHEARADVRVRMRAKLAAMSDEERHEASNLACTRLVNLEAFKHASVILLYMPLALEVDTTPAAIRCFQRGKTVCVPRVDWNRKDMNAVEVTTFDDHFMETDEHGLRSPRGGRLLVPASIDLAIVPGLAFDTHGNRVGRGGGYYDRFLSRLRRSATSLGLAFDAQIIDEAPVSERHVRLDGVVTDRRVSHVRRSRSRR
jgi:5-formyltetrahydrofolate cyclo-ligase